jgi:hypothetical protein
MSFDGKKLFELLPALYRLRDAQLAQNLPQPALGPLQALLAVIAEQIAAVEDDLDQLYDDQFIETCATWVIPYIGDLIGYQPVHGVAPAVASPRAEVAHTISFRRRKGTVLVLEQLARDVTGWGAHAVEFFKLLADTQYMNHIRPHNYYAPDLRRWQPRAYMDGGFDTTAHTVDVRRIAVGRGRYNIQNIGIFLWSLNSYSQTLTQAFQVPNNSACFRFSSLGRDIPLFNNPVTQGADITAPAEPQNVADRLRRHVLCNDIAAINKSGTAVYYGAGNSLVLYTQTQPNGPLTLVAPSAIQVCDLSGADGHWANMPSAKSSQYAVAIDPWLGRIALQPPAPGASPRVVATYYYGFSGAMGGGEYARSESFTAGAAQSVVHVPGDYLTVQAALSALPGDGVVEISDSNTYTELAGVNVNVRAGGHIELRARDGAHPTLVLNGELSVFGGADAEFDLNGILITSSQAPAGAESALVHVPATDAHNNVNALGTLQIKHCTLVPGWALTPQGAPQHAGQPTLIVEPADTQAVVQLSILGSVQVQALATAKISDSIVDANGLSNVAYAALDGTNGGGALTLQGCTVIGKVHATLLTLVSDSIFWAGLAKTDTWKAPLWADRRQQGCVNFSYLPEGAITPRQYKCVVEGPGAAGPLFESLRYGDPNYCKLFSNTDDSVRRGADDGGEMGGFHFLLSPQRETDLKARMQEYLPVGLEYGIFYQT